MECHCNMYFILFSVPCYLVLVSPCPFLAFFDSMDTPWLVGDIKTLRAELLWGFRYLRCFTVFAILRWWNSWNSSPSMTSTHLCCITNTIAADTLVMLVMQWAHASVAMVLPYVSRDGLPAPEDLIIVGNVFIWVMVVCVFAIKSDTTLF